MGAEMMQPQTKMGEIFLMIFMFTLSNSVNGFKFNRLDNCKVILIFRKDGKCNHSSVIVDSKIMIFGGYNANLYASSDIQLIELD